MLNRKQLSLLDKAVMITTSHHRFMNKSVYSEEMFVIPKNFQISGVAKWHATNPQVETVQSRRHL